MVFVISGQPIGTVVGTGVSHSSYWRRPILAQAPDRFDAAWRQASRDLEKRQCPRRSLRCVAMLIDDAGEKKDPVVISAECTNVSNGGLFAIVPIGYGVAIGQRYTFQLAIEEPGPEPGLQQHVSQQGKIIRAELLLGDDGHADHVGIGVHLFGLRTGMLPNVVTA